MNFFSNAMKSKEKVKENQMNALPVSPKRCWLESGFYHPKKKIVELSLHSFYLNISPRGPVRIIPYCSGVTIGGTEEA
jgi:hypothetical protein